MKPTQWLAIASVALGLFSAAHQVSVGNNAAAMWAFGYALMGAHWWLLERYAAKRDARAAALEAEFAKMRADEEKLARVLALLRDNGVPLTPQLGQYVTALAKIKVVAQTEPKTDRLQSIERIAQKALSGDAIGTDR